MCVLHTAHILVKGIAAVWYNNEKMAVVIREWLRKQALYTNRDGIFRLMPVMEKMQ